MGSVACRSVGIVQHRQDHVRELRVEQSGAALFRAACPAGPGRPRCVGRVGRDGPSRRPARPSQQTQDGRGRRPGGMGREADRGAREGDWRKCRVRETTEAIVGAVSGPLSAPRTLLLARYDPRQPPSVGGADVLGEVGQYGTPRCRPGAAWPSWWKWRWTLPSIPRAGGVTPVRTHRVRTDLAPADVALVSSSLTSCSRSREQEVVARGGCGPCPPDASTVTGLLMCVEARTWPCSRVCDMPHVPPSEVC